MHSTDSKAQPADQPGRPRRPWRSLLALLVGKAVRLVSRLSHHGGSALPGKVVERIDPGFLARTLSGLPRGVVLVSGTNGKTTTTRMVASMLESLGLKVFTNPTGSNFTRGVVSALVSTLGLSGRLNADIAVLELDEAYAVHFVRQVKPRYALLLNVMRDQLDRFGEIDTTARLLGQVARATRGTVVLNREDPRIASLAAQTPAQTGVAYFGLSDDLLTYFPTDDDMHASDQDADGAATASTSRPVRPGHRLPAEVTLERVMDHRAAFRLDGRLLETDLRLEGVYNLYNAAAALALVRVVLEDREPDDAALMDALSKVTPAFGRGEVITYQGAPVELVLVKNPMGFRLALTSFDSAGQDTMIAIRDEYADGRDMSWLWDVDFTSLRDAGVAMVSGTRAYDMALRLAYDQVPTEAIETDLDRALTSFLEVHPGRPKRIYCTYTSMLRLRSALGRITSVDDAGVGA
ncbi:Mur ligase family protein [Bifidobacterium sp. wkB344]|uniref:Mur ligase family protein n=1 Tax=Bifidobacterium sp. wkB344 TaxID=2025113 RepID=UPI000EFA0214|nr:Mur ligase family protein [Bifidobacterium sp. wkB344]RMA44631.1 glutamate ligase [Bifidobacterium sp. wkB344]